jgi:class 3 adenylate cyclase
MKGGEAVAPKLTNENVSTVAPQETAERRQVTVMFSDLVGSTALSARMDPEDLREVISSYQKCVAESVQRFGGFVAKYMGDGVLIYFGYPQAHEDDAERAVRAGLELVAAVSARKTHAPLQTRVGIATGLLVVGDLIGSGASQEQAIVGETPNLAARLQGIAEPNSVVIADGTRKLLGNLFELEDLGEQNLKGIAGSVRAWAALREFGGGPFRGNARYGIDRPRWAGRRTRLAAATVVKGKDPRRPGGVALRRSRHWQVAAHGSTFGTPYRPAPYAPALFLFAAAH